jgi:transcriptional regulator with XRE-family HTH domain
MTSAHGSSGKAVEGIRAFAAELAENVPGFAEAAEIEREADQFCQSVRKSLAQQRAMKCLEQSALAREMGLSQPAISRIERGEGDIGLKTIFRYSRALGLKPYLTFAPSVTMAPPPPAHVDPVLAAVAADVAEAQDNLMESVHRSLVEHQRLQEVLAHHIGVEEETAAAGV